jgi:uncharacterized protein YwqG
MELKDLEPFLEKIVKIEKVEGEPKSTDSYMGGHPFVPANGESWEWPTTNEDEPMAFIIQINFRDMPAGLGYPEHGIMQIFMDMDAADDELPDALRIFYYDEYTSSLESLTNPSDEGPELNEYNPLDGYSPKRVVFKKSLQIPKDLYYDARVDREESDLSKKARKLKKLLAKSEGELPKDLEYLADHSHQFGGVFSSDLEPPLNKKAAKASFMIRVVEDDEICFGDGVEMYVWGDLKAIAKNDFSKFKLSLSY